MKKKFLIIACTLLFCAIGLYAQQVTTNPEQFTFQGKLIEDEVSVNGPHNFMFTIIENGINWSEIHIDIEVTNGLYSLVLGSQTPLPQNMFETQDSIPLNIIVDGVPLSPATILNKPYHIELQQLELIDDTLLVLTPGGGSVILPQTSFQPGEFIIGEVDTILINIVNQNNGGATANVTDVWQTFVAQNTCILKSVLIEMANYAATNINFKLFEGTDITGQAIYSKTYPADNFPIALDTVSIPINDPVPVNIHVAQTYTILFEGLTSDFIIGYNGNNPYVSGECSISPDADLYFSIFAEINTDIGITVTEAGDVGIGTETPMAKLHVKAAGYDSTQFAFLVTNNEYEEDLIRVRNDGVTVIPGLQIMSSPNQATSPANKFYVDSLVYNTYKPGVKVYDQLGTYQFVVTTTSLTVELWGGGSGGQTHNYSGNYQSGGAGGYALKNLEVNIGDTIQVSVGNGGTGGHNTYTAGGSSSFGSYVSATGGGTNNVIIGGSGLNGHYNINGGYGGQGTSAIGGKPYMNNSCVFGCGGDPGEDGLPGLVIIKW